MPPSRLTASRPWALRNWATRAERAPTAQTQTTRSSTSSMRCISWSIGMCTDPRCDPRPIRRRYGRQAASSPRQPARRPPWAERPAPQSHTQANPSQQRRAGGRRTPSPRQPAPGKCPHRPSARPTLHRLALAGIKGPPVTGGDQLRDLRGGEFHNQPVVDQHREDRLIDLDRVRPEPAAAPGTLTPLTPAYSSQSDSNNAA